MDDIYIGGDFSGQDLSGETVEGTYVGVKFITTDLRGATLIGTFMQCDFSYAKVTDWDISRATFTECNFENIIK